TKRLSQLLLAPTKHQATHANFIAHLSINRTGCLYAWPMRRGTHAKISLCGVVLTPEWLCASTSRATATGITLWEFFLRSLCKAQAQHQGIERNLALGARFLSMPWEERVGIGLFGNPIPGGLPGGAKPTVSFCSAIIKRNGKGESKRR